MRWGELTEGKREAPEPLEGNIRAVVSAIAGLWALAFLVLLPFYGRLADEGRTDWLWTCLAGAGLGLLGLWYVRAREAGIRAAGSGGGAGGTGASNAERPTGPDGPAA